MRIVREVPPIEFKIPEIGKDVDRVVLPSGATVFVKEDHTAPSVSMRFFWSGGHNSVPVEDLAPFELAGDLLNEGGTQSLDPVALTGRMEALGMNFSMGIGGTSIWGSFWSLKRNFKEAFDLATDVIMQPRFDEDRLKTLKGQYVDQMQRRWDDPSWGVSMIQRKVLDGDHPRFGRVVTRAEIEKVTSEQCRRAWRRFIGRDNLFITVVGDFDRKQMWRPSRPGSKTFIKRRTNSVSGSPETRCPAPGSSWLRKTFRRLRCVSQDNCRWTAPLWKTITPRWKF